MIFGFGGSYKWFFGCLFFMFFVEMCFKEKYGILKYFDFGFDFSWKKVFVDVDYY